MTNITPPTPGVRPEINQPENHTQHSSQPRPPVTAPSLAPQTPTTKSGVEVKLPIGDTAGEKAIAGGGIKAVINPIDPSRANLASGAPTAPVTATTTPTEPTKLTGDTTKSESNPTAAAGA
jgi:hypothetical protein